MALLRYIHENPVRAGMVEKPDSYAWSSAQYFRKGRGPAWLDLDSVLAMLGATRSAATAAHCRLMNDRCGTTYEDLAAIAGVVKGGEAFARKVLPARGRVAQLDRRACGGLRRGAL